ncbi:MAG: sulfite exporter TauE/SafE family protein [Burkholderiales bacterium]
MAETIVFLGALAGGFVSGLAGFGTGLTALGIWLYVMKPPVAASLVVVCSVLSQLQTIPMIWHAIKPRLVAPFIIGGLAGVPLGTALVLYLDPYWFRFGIGIVLLVFSTAMLRGGSARPMVKGGQVADAVVGFGGGVLGGLAGLSGPLPTMWATLRAWGKDQRRSVFQSFNLTILVAALAAHAVNGMLTAELWRLVLVAIPGTFIGSWLGARLYRRLSDKRFQIVVLLLLAISGVILIATSAAKFIK